MFGEAVKGEPRRKLQLVSLRSVVESQILDTSKFKVINYSQHLGLPSFNNLVYLCF